LTWNHDLGSEVRTLGAPPVEFGAPVEFGGAGNQWTPETLLLASAEACTLLTFLAYARRRKVEVLDYVSRAEGTLGPDSSGLVRFVQITIDLEVEVEAGQVAAAEALIGSIQGKCFVGSSLREEPILNVRVIGRGEKGPHLAPE